MDAQESVGLASYQLDLHHTSRIIVDGVVKAEGCIESHVKETFPVSYHSIDPRKAECSNLLIPVCLSSTHVSYGSICMEPVFMLHGQSAVTAAVFALEAGASVQKSNTPKLRARLLTDGQVLDRPPGAKEPVK